MRMEEFEHRAFGDHAAIVQPVHDLVVAERGAALVHDLRLALRIKILRDIAHDAHQLALPIFEPRRALFDEIKQVFLGQAELPLHFFALRLVRVGVDLVLIGLRHGAPQIVERRFGMSDALAHAPALLGEVRPGTAGVAIDAVVL